MSELGQFQSLYQLAVALSFGALALESLLERPIERRSRDIRELELKTLYFSVEPHGPHYSNVLPKMANLAKDIRDKFVQRDVSFGRNLLNYYGLMKLLLLVCAIYSLYLLGNSTTSYEDPVGINVFFVAMLLNLIPISIIFVMIGLAWRVGVDTSKLISNWDDQYRSLVDESWGKPSVETSG